MSIVDDVRSFWESQPLWSGESQYETGSREYFEEHRDVYIKDCFAGKLDPRVFPDRDHSHCILDLGCGPGFWTIELAKRGCTGIVASDLTKAAMHLTKRRCEVFGVEADVSQQNAEKLTFGDEEFSHVNCQGVIHHTPDTKGCAREIARVLKKGGTATISVYYRNVLLRSWPFLRFLARPFSRGTVALKGRGRETMLAAESADDLVRMYDGSDNPLGKCYGRSDFADLFVDSFEIKDIFFHFFPARALPFPIPTAMHRLLDSHMPFMIYASLRKL